LVSESEIVRRAGEQHGVFTHADVAEAGLSASAITRRVRAGVWVRVLPGVYRLGGTEPTARTDAMAAVLWAGEGSLISHATAAGAWGIEGVRAHKPELWVPEGHRKRSSLVAVHRGTRLDRADRVVLDGVPITSPTRTLIDVSGRLEDDALLAAMESAFRSGGVTPARLAARLEALRTPGRVGAGRLEALLAARPAGAAALESRHEAAVWGLLVRSGLPRPERQHWVVAGGNRYRLDFAWPLHMVAVECKGFAFHGGREHFEPGELRTADLISAGWRVVPVTWKHAHTSPDRSVERLTQTLARPIPSAAAVQ
jgi:very-short-patch-repair endonuclease